MANSKKDIKAIVKSISERTDLPEKKVKSILTELFGITISRVADGERVVFRGLGSFHKKTKKKRKYRDLRTGVIKESSPASAPAFQPSKVLLREMNPAHTTPVGTIINESERKKETTAKPEQEQLQVPTEPNKCEVIISAPNSKQTDCLHIKYAPNSAFDSFDVYPVVYTPAPNSYLKLPRVGRSDVVGYKEPDFLAKLTATLNDISISDNFHLRVPGRIIPYEPDIVLFDEELNFYIDVEIDEPYDGYSRLVTHILEDNREIIRNYAFKDSGWCVVRFSERQVHLQSEQCIGFLRWFVDTMRGVASPPPPYIEKEDRWNQLQAIQWEKDLYREKYLGIQFFLKQVRSRKVLCLDEEEGIDSVIQRTPYDLLPIKEKPSLFNQPSTKVDIIPAKSISNHSNTQTKPRNNSIIPLSERHPSSLSFKEESHTYSTPGDDTGISDRMSVTTLIEQFFPRFDEEKYIKKRMEETGMTEEAIRRELAEPSERGTDLHKQIENYLKGLPYDDSSKEFKLFLNFYQEQIVRRGLEFDSAEYAIELNDSNIAGTVDALFRKADGEYVMIDWKRSKHLIIDGYPKKYGFGRGLSVLSHLDNSSYYKYEIQQSFYKYILEKDYGIKISSMILVVLYPDYDRYYSIRLSEYRIQEVLDMIESYEKTQ